MGVKPSPALRGRQAQARPGMIPYDADAAQAPTRVVWPLRDSTESSGAFWHVAATTLAARVAKRIHGLL